MNDTQLIAELECLYMKEESRAKEIELLKNSIINILGLNMVPVNDPVTGKLRMPEENEIMPLAALIGSPELLSEVAKKHQEMMEEQKVEEELELEGLGEVKEWTPEELEDFINEDSEFDFIDDPEAFRKHMIWNSLETKQALSSMVVPLESLEDPYEELGLNDDKEEVKKTKKRIVIDE